MPSPTTTAPVAPWALPVPVCTAPAAPRWEVYCPDGKVRLDVAATVPAARAAARRCGCRWGAAGHLAFDLSADPMVESSGVRL